MRGSEDAWKALWIVRSLNACARSWELRNCNFCDSPAINGLSKAYKATRLTQLRLCATSSFIISTETARRPTLNIAFVTYRLENKSELDFQIFARESSWSTFLDLSNPSQRSCNKFLSKHELVTAMKTLETCNLLKQKLSLTWPLQLVEALSDSEAGGPLPECTGQVVVKLNLGHSTNRFEARSLREGVLLLRRGKINAFVSQG